MARPVIALSVVGAFTAFTASMTLLISTPFRLHDLGFTAAEIGAAIAPWPLTNMIIAPLAGYLSDRIPAGILGGIGMTISIAALSLLATMPVDPSYFDVAWRMALCGSGFGIFLPPNARLIIGSAARERAAAAGGLVSTVRLIGQTSGATLVAALLAMGVGSGHVPPIVAAGTSARRRGLQPRPDATVDPQSDAGGDARRRPDPQANSLSRSPRQNTARGVFSLSIICRTRGIGGPP